MPDSTATGAPSIMGSSNSIMEEKFDQVIGWLPWTNVNLQTRWTINREFQHKISGKHLRDSSRNIEHKFAKKSDIKRPKSI